MLCSCVLHSDLNAAVFINIFYSSYGFVERNSSCNKISRNYPIVYKQPMVFLLVYARVDKGQ